MTYFVLATIKTELGITDTNSDTLLNTFGADSDDHCNNRLAPFLSIPIQTPDNNVIDASNMGVIARYYKATGMLDKAMDYYQLADQYLDQYIQRLLLTKTATLVPQYFITTTGNVNTENNSIF